MKSTRFVSILLLVALFTMAFAVPAFAMDGHDCNHEDDLISLQHCIHHAADMGHIANTGVATGLSATVNAAQTALERGQTNVAANLVNAFINEVQAQSGKQIDAEHAGCLVDHANEVLAGFN